MKNRKKMAGTIAMIMALSLGYNAGGPVVVHAHENAVITEKSITPSCDAAVSPNFSVITAFS